MRPTNFKELQAPFAPEHIQERKGAGNMTFSYIGVRTIMDRLDRVLGPGNWSTEYRDWGEQGIVCRMGIKVLQGGNPDHAPIVYAPPGWVYKENLGVRSDIEGEKGGITAAFRRVAQNEWGIGRELYEEPTEDAPPEPESVELMSYADAHRELRWTKEQTKLALGVEHFTEYFGDEGGLTPEQVADLNLVSRFMRKSVEAKKSLSQMSAWLGDQGGGKGHLMAVEPAELRRYV